MKRIIGQAIILGTLVAVPATAIAKSATDASPLDDKKGDKSKDKDKKDSKKKTPAPAPPSSSHSH
jgi:ABC-type Fe2+-enterobactin transport system substrate-binding protein